MYEVSLVYEMMEWMKQKETNCCLSRKKRINLNERIQSELIIFTNGPRIWAWFCKSLNGQLLMKYILVSGFELIFLFCPFPAPLTAPLFITWFIWIQILIVYRSGFILAYKYLDVEEMSYLTLHALTLTRKIVCHS